MCTCTTNANTHFAPASLMRISAAANFRTSFLGPAKLITIIAASTVIPDPDENYAAISSHQLLAAFERPGAPRLGVQEGAAGLLVCANKLVCM